MEDLLGQVVDEEQSNVPTDDLNYQNDSEGTLTNRDSGKEKKKKRKKTRYDKLREANGDNSTPFGVYEEYDVENPKTEQSGSIEMANADDKDDGETDSEVDIFLKEVAELKAIINSEIKKSLNKMKKLHQKSRKATKASQVKKIREDMQAEISIVSKKSGDVKKRIEKLNTNPNDEENENDNGATNRMRRSVLMALEKKLKMTMQDFSTMRSEFQEDYKEVVERRYYTITGEEPDEATLDQLVDTGDSETLFQQAIESQGRGSVLDTITEIQERHDAIVEVEQGLLELHQIFLDMATLVEQQGEVVDLISTQIESAQEYINEAKESMTESKRLHLSIKRKQCFILLVVLGIIALIVILVVVIL